MIFSGLLAPAIQTAMSASMMQTMFAISALQSAVQFFGQQQQASAMADYQQRMYQQNKEIADQAAVDQYQGLGTRTYQEREAAALDIMNASRAAREAMSTARVSAGEAGVSGASADALLQDFERRQFEYTYGRSRSQDFREQAFEDQKKGIRSQQQGRVLSMLPKPVERPSFLGAALRIGAGYMDAKRMFSVPVWDGSKYNLQSY
tara:strand:+ start:4872 stop:5486 length:615 start_codon:yes stop_codon:yes gene_type:complete